MAGKKFWESKWTHGAFWILLVLFVLGGILSFTGTGSNNNSDNAAS